MLSIPENFGISATSVHIITSLAKGLKRVILFKSPIGKSICLVRPLLRLLAWRFLLRKMRSKEHLWMLKVTFMDAEGDKTLRPDGFHFGLPSHFGTFFGKIFLDFSKSFIIRQCLIINYWNPSLIVFPRIGGPSQWMTSDQSCFLGGSTSSLHVFLLADFGMLWILCDLNPNNLHSRVEHLRWMDLVGWGYWHQERNKSGIILKLDFENAYDQISWDVLCFFMHQIGYEDRWIKWIQRCVTYATVSVLVNGTLSLKLKMDRGLRHRCPLFPLLFNLVAKVLLNLLNQCQYEGWFHSIAILGLLNGMTVL